MPRDLARTMDLAPDARWADALRLTVGLWFFTLLLYLPSIVGRHSGEPFLSIVLDCSSIIPSMLFALLLFALFRRTEAIAPTSRILLMVVAIFVLAAAQTYFDHIYTAWVAATLQPSWASLAINLRSAYSTTLLYAGVFAVNVALFQLAYAHRRTRRQDQQLADLTSTAQRSELDHLRLRLNPHLLFNALNGLSAMVVTDRKDDAEEMIARLSSFLRATVARDPAATVPLAEEITIVERYLAVEEFRFAERLRVTIDDAGAAADATLPALSIQPLVEVAVRDGLASASRWVHLRLRADKENGLLVIRLLCRFRRAWPLDDDAREAVANLRRRLLTLYGGQARLQVEAERGGFAAILHIPSGEEIVS